MLLLVPADPLHPRRSDEHFAPEAEAARSLGLRVQTLDIEAAAGGDSTAAARLVEGPDPDAVYRGWMLRSEHYLALAGALEAKGVRLRTAPALYQRAHELPGWYAMFRPLSPVTAWLDWPGLDGFEQILAALPAGAAVIKDYVKSMKHYWAEAALIADTRNVGAASVVARRFLELRGEDLVGGLVVRQFERFTGPEVRTWWMRGSCQLVSAHPDSPDMAPPEGIPLRQIAPAVRSLGAPFVTVDLARRDDGRWRVVEVGDGQVSDRPESLDPQRLIGALRSG